MTTTKLASKKFALIRGSIITKRFESLPASNLHYVSNALQSIDYLAQGKVDLIVIGKYAAAEIITNQRPHLIGKFEYLQIKESNSGFRLAFSSKNENHTKIKAAFNKGLVEIERNGILKELSIKYGIYPTINAANKKVVTIGTVNNRDMLILKELSSTFEKANPEIDIRWRIYDENTLRNRTLSDLAISGGQFDIMTIGLQEIPAWSKNKWLSPITNLPEDYEVSDIFQNLMNAHYYKSELYALPFYAESSVTYYRKDLFSKAGIIMPERPTYNNIIKYAEALHNPSEGIYGICLRGKVGWGENIGLFTTMVNTHGGKWFDKNWKPQINSTPWKEALNTYTLLITHYGPPQPTLNGYNENLQLFLKGKCGIWIDATIASSALFDDDISLVTDLVGVAQAPTALTSNGANWLWSWSFAIPASSTNKGAAQKFITWATSKSYISLVSQKKGLKLIPQGTRRSTYASKTYQANLPYSEVLFEAILDAGDQDLKYSDKPYKGIQFVEISEFPAIGNYLSLLIIEVIKGSMTPEDALKKAQNYVNLQMDLSGYYKTGSPN